MEWRTDEPPKTGQQILAAVEACDYGNYVETPVAFVAEASWYDNNWGERFWGLRDETPVRFTKWMPFPEYPK